MTAPRVDPTGKRGKLAASSAVLVTLAAMLVSVVYKPNTGPVVTPPPVVVDSTPAVTPPSGGAGVSSIAVISDDFTKYASTAVLMANVTANNTGGTGPRSGAFYNDGYSAHLASIDPTVKYNGHATLKLSQPAGTSESASLSASFPHPLTHIWYRAKIRFSPGWTDKGTTTGAASAYKIMAWGWGSPCGSGRVEITNVTQYDFYENLQDCGSGAVIGAGTHAVGGNVNTEWTDGAWYDYIVEVDHTSTASGVIRLWIAHDGDPPVLRATAIEKAGTSPLVAIGSIGVGLNFNQVRTAAQSIWWGQWEVVDGTAHPNPYNLATK